MKHFQSVRTASTPFKCFELYMCPSHCIVTIVLQGRKEKLILNKPRKSKGMLSIQSLVFIFDLSLLSSRDIFLLFTVQRLLM